MTTYSLLSLGLSGSLLLSLQLGAANSSTSKETPDNARPTVKKADDKQKKKAPEPLTYSAESSVYNENEMTYELTGNVTVKRTDLTLICDKMIFFFKEKVNTTEQPEETDATTGSGSKELDHILCIGNVKVVQPDGRTTTSDKATYQVKKDIITLIENCIIIDESGSKMTSEKISIFRKDKKIDHIDTPEINGVILQKKKAKISLPGTTPDKAVVEKTPNKTTKPPAPMDFRADKSSYLGKDGRYILSGNVLIKDDRFKLTCRKMTIFRKDFKQPDGSMKQDVEKILCERDVVIVQNGQTIKGERAIYDRINDMIIMTGNCKLIQPDGSIMYTNEAIYNRQEGKMTTGTIYVDINQLKENRPDQDKKKDGN